MNKTHSLHQNSARNDDSACSAGVTMGAIVAVAFSFLASACVGGPADVGSEGVDGSLCIEDQDAEGAAILSCPAEAFESTRGPVDDEPRPSLGPEVFEPAFDRFHLTPARAGDALKAPEVFEPAFDRFYGVAKLPAVPEATEPMLDRVDFDGVQGPGTFECPPVYCDDVRCWCRVFQGGAWCAFEECPPTT